MPIGDGVNHFPPEHKYVFSITPLFIKYNLDSSTSTNISYLFFILLDAKIGVFNTAIMVYKIRANKTIAPKTNNIIFFLFIIIIFNCICFIVFLLLQNKRNPESVLHSPGGHLWHVFFFYKPP